jgi:hypothetical protein
VSGSENNPRRLSPFAVVFVAVFIGTALVVGAFLVQQARPASEVEQPSAQMVKATGKCASCHREETPSVVHQYELSTHASEDVNCLDCHRPADGQKEMDHRGFTIAASPTAANCKQCHSSEYEQYRRSRHGAPAWAAVRGSEPFTKEQIEFAEKYHPGAVDRPPNALAQLEGAAAMASGCQECHDIGKPNPDGSIGTCTECHSRHTSSLELARSPATCGQCHMGPDHSQYEIYKESKHGVMFTALRDQMNLGVDPEKLTTEDMPVPTCATCHMSGLEGAGVTHDVTQRLSYWLFAPVSEKRPHYARAQDAMQRICTECHASSRIETFYEDAEEVVASTNEIVKESQGIVEGLREDGILTEKPFDEPIEYVMFDLWHYYGRTAKHGAFMGGADFVQWHGFYELFHKRTELREMARELRKGHGSGDANK